MRTAHQNVPTPQLGREAVNKDYADSLGGAVGSVFIFQPSGTAVDNVYVTWSLLMADLTTVSGRRFLEFDDQFAAIGPNIPAGSYDMTDVVLIGRPAIGAAPSLVNITLTNAVEFTSFREIRRLKIVADNIPTITDMADGDHFVADDHAEISGNGANFMDLTTLTSGQTVTLDVRNGSKVLFSGDDTVYIPNAGSILVVNVDAMSVLVDAISGDGSPGTVQINSASANASAKQGSIASTTYTDLARRFPRAPYAGSGNITCVPGHLAAPNNFSGSVLAFLPVASAYPGTMIVVKNYQSSTNAITITPNGADTIDGAATKAISTAFGVVYLVSDGVSDWHIIGAGSVSGSIVSHPASGAARSTYGATTPRVVGAFAFNPSDYTVNGTLPTLAFRVLAANGVAALTNSVQLYNLTDSAVVTTLNFTITSTVKQSTALTIGGGAGQVPNSEKIYEVRIFLGADPGGNPLKTIELYSAHLVATNVL
jgi:hypothetical protein